MRPRSALQIADGRTSSTDNKSNLFVRNFDAQARTAAASDRVGCVDHLLDLCLRGVARAAIAGNRANAHARIARIGIGRNLNVRSRLVLNHSDRTTSLSDNESDLLVGYLYRYRLTRPRGHFELLLLVRLRDHVENHVLRMFLAFCAPKNDDESLCRSRWHFVSLFHLNVRARPDGFVSVRVREK